MHLPNHLKEKQDEAHKKSQALLTNLDRLASYAPDLPAASIVVSPQADDETDAAFNQRQIATIANAQAYHKIVFATALFDGLINTVQNQFNSNSNPVAQA